MRYSIFNCKKIYTLNCNSMERTLSTSERAGVRFHMMMCTPCRRYRRQMLFINRILRDYGKSERHACYLLPDETRERIKEQLLPRIREYS